MKNAKASVWLQLIVGYIVIALLLFISAGTIQYWQVWAYVAVSAITSVPLALQLTRNPRLLENRTRAGPMAEQRLIQKIIVTCLMIPLLAMFVVPGLDDRFGWSNAPSWLTAVGSVFIIAAMWIVYRVFSENPYGSATVEIAQDQKVISTGPYAIVRNPMYSGAAVYFIGMALTLGSYWGLVPAALIILGFVWRLFDEEKYLAQNLPGYGDYCAKVRWHLIPGVF